MKTWKITVPPQIKIAILLMGISCLYYIAMALGYTLAPVNRAAPAVMSTLITAAVAYLTVKCIKHRKKTPEKPDITYALMPLIAIIFVIGKAAGYDTDGIELYLLPVYAYIMLACGMAMFFACVKSGSMRVWLGIIYSAVIIPMLPVLLLWDFSPKPVAASELSPGGTLLAEVALSDQGIFGSSTLVRVTRQGMDIELPVGVFRKNPEQIYKGGYTEHETMTIAWEDDETLIINGKRYAVD